MSPNRGTTLFHVPEGLVVRKITAAGVNCATRWEVFRGDIAPAIGDWDDEDKRWLGDIVRRPYAAGWSWQDGDGNDREFVTPGPIEEILKEEARKIREKEDHGA